MVERRRIGLIYSMDKGWIGGTYYILNLISALNKLEESRKPTIVVICKSKDEFSYVNEYTHYPYLEYSLCQIKKPAFIRRINFLTTLLFNKSWLRYPSLPLKISALYPISCSEMQSRNYTSIAWIPDFQDKVLPHFFTKKDLVLRNLEVKKLISSNIPIVFSSKDAENDFYKYYPQKGNNQTFVMHFSVSLPFQDESNDENILNKYNISSPYFFCANQFWAHKNHITLFKSVKVLKDKSLNIKILLSGNTNDYRNPNFFSTLEKYIAENNLKENIIILGFIDRKEQLCLIKHSEAIIQPSLFEGWGTTVEDAKSLHKHVILSDISLHREQMTQNVSFFRPLDPNDLARKIENVLQNKPKLQEYDYNTDIKNFGECFINIIEKVTKSIVNT